MEIRTNFLPGNCVWIMFRNRPERFVVISVKIIISESMDVNITYTLATDVGPNEYGSKEVFETKQQLKESIFG